MKSPFGDRKGFTLVEMVILMIVVGIIATISGPYVTTAIQTMKLNNAAHKMASDIRYAREMALSLHSSYGIEANPAGNSYLIFFWDGANKTTVVDPHTQGSMVIDFDTNSAFSGVDLVSATEDEIRMDAFGRPLDDSGIALNAAASFTLQNGGQSKIINVTNETGFVEII